ncbi:MULTISPECIES: AAA family ATPase [unclassified Streptomyces]|uniref:AAA family ATPase n=1 Tax=unclassified Streptomyces TaxID=2593676 RepID=UPI001F040141|nr:MULTISPECIES: AAA family ATPase [unclassified Streptomyces]MCH0562792.1 AAA family ATPase [Streptomyces sp. MUM 2J]MCH0567697.1 AAA family ATPase [Streptomyces sp. MUM 136J]
MTAPLTPPPPHEPSAQGSPKHWPPSPGGYGYGRPAPHDVAYGQDGPGMKTELREGAVVMVAVAVTGALLGVLWWWLAPHVPLVGEETDGSWVVYLKDSEGEQAIGVDGTFTLLALAFGLVSALAVFAWRRRGGVPLVVGLGLGGLLGALLAWRVGVWLGPTDDVLAQARAVGKGVTFPAPLKLSAKGALLAWPLAALLVHLGLTSLFGPRDPEPPCTLPPAPPA